MKIVVRSAVLAIFAVSAQAQELVGNHDVPQQNWNWHVQNTDIVQYHPGFHADYSGPNSLRNASETRESVSLDLLVGARLWQGGEFHVDGLMWQGVERPLGSLHAER